MKKAATLLSIVFLLFLFSCQYTTANYSDLKTASSIDPESFAPVDITTVFSPMSPSIYVTGHINNAPSGTVMKIEWVYTEDDPEFLILDYALDATEINQAIYFEITRPNAGWPLGKYEARLYIDDVLEATLNFTVE